MAVPAGSPLEWSRSFPAITPGRSPFRKSPRSEEEDAEGRSRSTGRPRRLDVRTGAAQGLVRILTWDLAAHLDWIGPRRNGPTSGEAAGAPPRPRFGDALYWLSIAPLLRILLHPADVSRSETHAHLVEIGSYVENVLDVVMSERGLRDDATAVRALVAAPGGRPLPAIEAGSPRERMLMRFTRDALIREHPYAPEGSFGRELYLFQDEVFPYLVRFARAEHPFLRRNAVAALSRFETREALDTLVELALTASDPVVIVRALVGVGRFRGPFKPEDKARLLARVEQEREPVLEAAFMGALARSGFEELVPILRRRIERAVDADNGDALLRSLVALAEFRLRGPKEEEVEFFDTLERAIARAPRRFRPFGPKPEVQADIPEQSDTRGRILRQLVLIQRIRVDSSNEALKKRFLAPFVSGTDSAIFERRGSAMQSVAPAARFPYVESLRYVGDAGVDAMRTIANDSGLDPGLRGQALTALPYAARMALIAAWFRTGGGPQMRAIAFDWLVRDNASEVKEYGMELLAECAEMEAGGGSAPERHLYLTALRTLSEAGVLRAVDIAPLLAHVRAERNRHGSLAVEGRARIQALAREASSGVIVDKLKVGVDELLAFLREKGARPVVESATPKELRRYVLGALQGLRKHPGDANYRRVVVSDLVQRLLGFAVVVPNREFGEFDATVLLEEEILLALGRTREAEAAELLLQVLSEGKNRLRGHACLALGMTGLDRFAKELARFLLDPDPFVRFAAHESLRHLTGKSVDADWMFGSSAERFAAAEEYYGWLNEER